MRDRRKQAALALVVLLTFTTLLTGQVAPVYQVLVDVDPVELDVAVTERGKGVSQLSREDFVLLEDGQPQEIRGFEQSGMPFSILVLVDRSERDKKTKWPKFILDSVDLLFRHLRGPDRLAVAGFDDRVAVLIDWRPSKNGNAQKVMLRKSKQDTKFFEAINWASEEMEYIATTAGPGQPTRLNGRRGVVVFTDGRDRPMYPRMVELNGGQVPDPLYEVPASVEARFQQTRDSLERASIPFYFVAIDTDKQLPQDSARKRYPGEMRFLEAVRTRMEQLASVSGGRIVFPQQMEDLLPFYRQIQRDLGTGYHITYKPQRAGDGKQRRIEVKLRNSDLQIYQSRESYYAR
jgi:VWFA-related protein